MRIRTIRLVAVLACLGAVSTARAQPTAFTYQGQLKSGAQLATGSHDMRFRLFDAASGGAQVGATLCADNVAVAGGQFSVQLDFGQQFTSPAPRFLEILVRADIGQPCTDDFGYALLTPRQQLTAAPLAGHAHAAYALDAPDGSPAGAVVVDSDGNVGVGAGTPDLLDYGDRVLSLAGNRPRFEFQGSSATSANLGIIDFLDGDAGVASIIANADPATSSAHLNLHTKSLWLTGGNGAGLPTSAGPGLRMYYDTATDRAQVFAFNYQNATPRPLVLQDLPGANVGIGTSSPQARLEVRGDIRLGQAGELRAAAGGENLRIVRGTIGGDGTILAGTGFSVAHPSPGRYVVTFTTPFAALPTVTSSADRHPSPVAGHWSTMADNVTSESTEIVTRNTSTDEWVDRAFHFIAVGPR